MDRKEAEAKVKLWMEHIGTDDLRDYDCSGAQPENCTMEELLSVIEDAEEDQAIELHEHQLWLQSLEEQGYQDEYEEDDQLSGYLNEHGN